MQYRILVIHKSILLSYKGELSCNTIHDLNEALVAPQFPMGLMKLKGS